MILESRYQMKSTFDRIETSLYDHIKFVVQIRGINLTGFLTCQCGKVSRSNKGVSNRGSN